MKPRGHCSGVNNDRQEAAGANPVQAARNLEQAELRVRDANQEVDRATALVPAQIEQQMGDRASYCDAKIARDLHKLGSVSPWTQTKEHNVIADTFVRCPRQFA